MLVKWERGKVIIFSSRLRQLGNLEAVKIWKCQPCMSEENRSLTAFDEIKWQEPIPMLNGQYIRDGLGFLRRETGASETAVPRKRIWQIVIPEQMMPPRILQRFLQPSGGSRRIGGRVVKRIKIVPQKDNLLRIWMHGENELGPRRLIMNIRYDQFHFPSIHPFTIAFAIRG